MPKFIVEVDVTELHVATYEVEAEDEQEAWDNYYMGEFQGSDFVDSIDEQVVEVTQVEE